MDFGILKNLKPIQEATPAAAPTRPEATSKSPSGPSFGSVLAGRAKPAKSDDAPAAESDVESNEAAPSARPKLNLVPKQKSAVRGAKDSSISNVAANDTESAWSEFLGEMDEKLDIEPEDILQAFESLSEEDLAAKPEESVDQIVAAMGLSDQNAILAKQLLTKLIQKTDKAVAPDSSVAKPVVDIRAADSSALAAVAAKPAATGPTNKALEKPPVSGNLPAEGSEEVETAVDQGSSSFAEITAAALPTASEGAPKSPADEGATQPAARPAPVVSPLAVPGMNELVEQMQPVRTDEPTKLDATMQSLIDGATPRSALATEVRGEEATVESEPTSAPLAPRTPQKALDALIAKATQHAEDQEAQGHEDESESDLEASLAHPGDARLAHGSVKTDEFATKLSQEVKDAAPAAPLNGPELIDNARVMIRNGGGEMKVTVNSDVGEVAMNVSVKDGKVSVSMVAESDDAKKLLEQQLGDLKTQLTAHNLQIDKLQVDTSSNLANQNDSNQARDNQRQANQGQGWDNLNQQQQSRGQQQHQARRSAYDAPAGRAYGATRAKATAEAAPRAAARSENSGRLSVVA